MLDRSVKNIALIALAIWCGCALANPETPQVVSGNATFSKPNANTLNVTNSRNAIINWQSFNIGRGQTTNFIQPSSSSAVMNRVMGKNPSKIYGNLNSNGKVFLINQHGMMIGAGARINTAGFYGSTLNITNEDFLKGNLKFEGGGFGGINNQGYIHAGPNGNVVLIAPDIENGGVIEVDNGNVILAAGESIRITSLNDASIEFDVQSRDNSIINLGDIIAKQGAARLFAGSLQHSGSINATGIVRNADGSISLVAQADIEVTAGATLNANGDEGGSITLQSHQGDVHFSGSASARGESHLGGNIQILGERVGLFGEARVDVSGKTGGGEILVGGDFQGQGDTQTARQTQVSRGASLHADAIESGAGGKVIAWADDFTLFNGVANATGGDQSGDGGFIEISGKEALSFDGVVDTTAANGRAGTVLFDPRDISVFSGSPGTYTGIDDTFLENPTVDVSFSNASIEAALNSSNVVLQANNNISWSGSLSPTGSNDLTLQAGQSVFIFDTQGILSTNGGNLTLIANSTAADGVVDAARLVGAGNVTIGDTVQSATIQTNGGNLIIEIRDGAGITNAQEGTVTFDDFSSTDTGGGALIVKAASSEIVDTSGFGTGGIVTAGTAIIDGDLDMLDGSFTVSAGLVMQPGSRLDVEGGSITVGDLLLSSGALLEGSATLTGNVISNGGTIDPQGISGSIGVLTIAGDLTLSPTSTVVFDIAGNASPGIEYDVLNVTGNVTLGGNLVGFWDSGTQFVASDGMTFDIINGATFSGAFDQVYAPAGVIASSFNDLGTIYQWQTDTVDTGNVIFWENTVSGFWDIDTNWVGNVAPGTGQYAVIDRDELITVTIRTPVDVAGVQIGNDLTIVDDGATNDGQLIIDDLGAGFASVIASDLLTLNGDDGIDVLVTNADLLVVSQASWNDGDLEGTNPIIFHELSSLVIGNGADALNVPLTHNSVAGSSWNGGMADGAGLLTNNGVLDINGLTASAIAIDNAPFGTLIKSGVGTTNLTGSVINNGTVRVDRGILNLGASAVHGGIFEVASGATLGFGGTHTLFGALQGSGNVDMISAALTLAGSINPGGTDAIGILAITGNPLITGNINIEIQNGGGSPQAGVDYDRLQVSGIADLQGTLTLLAINGYTVANGETFVPVLYEGSLSNSLTFVPIGGEAILPTYNASDLSLLLGTPQIVTWNGGGDGVSWTDPVNWITGSVPGPLDDAVIPGGSGYSVTIAAAANAGTLSLASDATLTQTGSTFALALDSTLQGALALDAGSFSNGGILTMDGVNGVLTLDGGQVLGGTIATSGGGSVVMATNSTLNAATLNADLVIGDNLSLTVTNGLTLNGTITLANTGSFAILRFNDAQTLAGGGAIVMDGSSGPNNFVDSSGATGTLTIGSGINISGSGTVGTNSAGYLTLNLGTITANAGDTIQNDLLTNGPGGSLIVDGGSMTMAFAWDNLGTMTVNNGGAFDLGGTFPGSAISGGAYVNLDGASTTTITGSMDIGGGNFTITDAGTGTGDLQMILGGEIANGTLLQSGAATLLVTPTSPFAQLNNVSLGMDLTIGNGGTLRILNDLRINIGRTLTLASTGTATTLQASQPQSILGNGSIVLGGSSALNFIDSIGAAGTLTIGAGISISGSGTIGTNSAGFLTLNNGTITANAGDVINTDLLTNGVTGSLIADGGDVIMNFDWDNLGGAGSMVVSNGGSFTLGATGGSFPSSAIDSGRYVNSDGTGTTTLTGVMDIQGGSFSFTDAVTGIGDIEIFGGTLLNGTINQAGSATLSMAAGSGNLDNIVVDMDLTITNGRTLTIFNGLTINAGRTITLVSIGGGAFLSFNGTQTLTGNGAILLDDTTNNGNLVRGVNGGDTLTIDTGITISGGGTVGTNIAGVNAINNGAIAAGAGNTITFQNFTNNGTLTATGGGILNFSTNVPFNDGIIDIGLGSTLTTNNANLNNIPGAIIRGSGTIDVGSGTLTNDGIVQPGGNLATGVLTILGNFTMGSTSDLQIEINDSGVVAGVDFDQLVVNGGSVTLDGLLTQSLLAGNPVAGTYRLIDVTAGALNGSFGLESLIVGFSPMVYTVGPPGFAETTYAGSGPVFWDDGGADGLWNTASNWSTDVLPTLGDDVTIGVFNVTIAGAADASTLSLAASGTLNINSGSLTIAGISSLDGDLTLNGGTLTGTGNVVLNGAFDWNGGTLAGNGLLTTTGASTINPAADLTLSRNWTNNGLLTWSNGNITLNSSRTFINTAIFNANAGAVFTVASGVEDFDNQGTLNVNSDTAFQGLGGFANSGSFVIASATTLSIETGISSDTGTWTIGDGAIDISGGSRRLDDGFSLTSTSGSLTVSGGALNVNTTAPLTLPATLTVNVNGGSLTGSGDLVVDGGFNWTGGNLAGTGLLTTNAISTINQAGGLTLSRSWTNAGTLDWQAGNVILNSGRTFTNTAIFNADAGAFFGVNSGAETFDNQGTLNVNIDTTFQGGGSLDNSGSFVIATATTLSIETGVSADTGTWTIGDGAIDISGGSRRLDDGFSLTSTSGSLTVSGGVLEVNTSSPLTLPATLAFNLSSGALTGSGDIVVDGAFTWTGGSLTGPGLFTTNATSTLNQPANLAISRDWVNAGTLNWQAGDIQLNSSRTFTNTGTFNADAGAIFSVNTGSESFNNQSTVNVNTNTTFGGGGALDNSGSLVVASATTLTIGTGSGSDSGTWDIGLGGINIAVGTRTLDDGFNAIATGGTLSISGGTLDVNTSSPLTLPAGLTLDLLAGNLTGSGDLVLVGALNWTGGTISGAGLLTTNGASQINQVGGLILSRNWTSNGLVSWQAGDLTLNNNSTFTSTGSFNANASLSQIVLNAGTSFVSQSNFTLGANIDISNGALFTHNAGLLNLGGLTLTVGGALTISGGELGGSGTVDGDLANNGGTIHPGGADTIGTISVTGNFTNTSGDIVIEIDNDVVSAGTSYDLITVGAQADLNDTLTLLVIGGYTATNNDTLSPITYASSINTFGTITPTGVETVNPDYTPPSLDLLLTLLAGILWDDGAGDGLWGSATNWSGDVLPGLGDDVAIGGGFNVTIAAGANASTLSLAAGSSLTLSGGTLFVANDSTLNGLFTMTGGTLDLTGMALTLAGGFTWNGGATIQGGGSGILNLPGITSVSGAGIHTLSSVTVNSSFIFTLNSAAPDDLQLEDGAIFNNTGSFDFVNDSNIFDDSGSPGTFNNDGGTLSKSGGPGTSTIGSGITFTNTAATIEVFSGTLVLGAGPVTLDSGSVLTGTGTIGNDVVNNGGTVEPGGVASVGTLSITGDFTNTTGTVVIDILNAVTTPGTDYDQLVVSNQADFGDTLQLNAIGTYVVANNDTFDPVAYATYGGTPFATIVPVGGENITPDYTTPDLTLVLSLSGLFTFTGAVDGVWNNPGNWDQGVPGIGNDVLIPTGFTVSIAAAANASTLSLAAGSTLDIDSGGVLTIANSATLDGLLSINAGGFDITGAVATVNAGLNWTGTSVITGGTLNLNSAFNVSGGVANILDGVTANVTGVTSYSAGNITLANGSVLNTSSIFDFAGDVGIADGGGATSSFNSFNGATIVKSAGVNSSVDSTLTSTHAGSVNVRTGTLDLNLALLDLGVGDVFSGAGTYIGNVVNNGGIVRPGGAGAVGTLTIAGDFTNNLGTLEVEIDSAITHDVLAVNNSLGYGNVAGSILEISYLSFIPSVAETHDVITCVGACDQAAPFGTVIQPTGVTHTVTYNANNLNLTVASTSFFWDGGGDGITWFDLNNWSLDVLPNAGTDVVLANGDNVTFDGGTATVASLTLDIGSSLDIASGTLTNAGLLAVNGGATLGVGGGELDNGGDANLDGSFLMGSGGLATFRGNSVFNGSYANNGGNATFVGTAAFNAANTHGGGTTTFNNTSSFAGATLVSGGTLTFNAVGTMLNLNNTWSGGTIAGAAGPNLVLGVAPGDTTLAVVGAGTKTLDAITLDMNQNDINMSGSGDLNLVGGAVIDNTDGTSFNHSGSGGITGTGTFDNTNGEFNKLSGSAVIAPTVTFINTGTSLVNVAGGALTFVAGGADAGNYSVGGNGTLAFTNGKTLAAGSALNLAGNLVVGNGVSPTTLTLPGTLVNSGNIQLNNATLDLSNLGGTLPLTGGAGLGGTGTVAGNVANNNGTIVVGGAGALGDLAISGSYDQGGGSVIVIDAFNNGFTTVSDQLTIGGPSTLNGGTLVIGFTTNSLGLVTTNFSPITASSGVSGGFDRIIDAGGNLLLINFKSGVFTVLGASPKIPDTIIDDLISFLQDSDELAAEIASNRSEAEGVMEELLREEELEQGSLVCN